MAHVHDESVSRRIEHAMQRDGQLDYPEIRTQMSPGLRKDLDQLIAHFLRELGQILLAQRFDIRRRTDRVEQALGRSSRLGRLRRV
jgi:hypothetical protein